ncbi:MAG: cytochrome c [Gammaproteobacteria bacterium]|nr:cytochrome c [Gammaproteobacteria bacterium]
MTALLWHSAGSAQQPVSIWDGIYNEAQAQRGADHYRARCASCHSADLRGNSNSPSLLGMSFMFVWEGRSVGELFEKMRAEMPTDQPGSLPTQAYIDVLAFILSSNEFPAGKSELAADQSLLNGIAITPR